MNWEWEVDFTGIRSMLVGYRYDVCDVAIVKDGKMEETKAKTLWICIGPLVFLGIKLEQAPPAYKLKLLKGDKK